MKIRKQNYYFFKNNNFRLMFSNINLNFLIISIFFFFFKRNRSLFFDFRYFLKLKNTIRSNNDRIKFINNCSRNFFYKDLQFFSVLNEKRKTIYVLKKNKRR
jgi:hypothetical protein